MFSDVDPQKILIIRTHRLGDILQVTPMIRGLREQYPAAVLSILVAEGFQGAIEANPDLDAVITFPRSSWIDRLQATEKIDWGVYREIRDFVRKLRCERFDRIINRQFTDFEALLTHLLAPTVFRGKVIDDQGHVRYADPVTQRVIAETMARGRNPALKNLVDLSCEVADVSPSERRLVFPVRGEVVAACRQRLLGRGGSPERPLYGIQPGASRSFKKLESDSLASVVDYLIQAKRGMVLFLGTAGERALGEEILQRIRSDRASVVNLMGETTLEELGGFLTLCDLLITGDTGTVHVAAAVGTPTLSASYGMTYPYETAPYGPEHLILYSDLPCAPCDDPDLCRKDMACRRVLQPEVMILGIDLAHALAAGEEGEVRRIRQDPLLKAVRLLYTGREKITPPLTLYDLQVEIPPLPASNDSVVIAQDAPPPAGPSKCEKVLDAVQRIRQCIAATVEEFDRGNKAEGFQAILPVFDLINGIVGEAGVAEFPSGLPGLLNRIGQVMERMDLALLQELLVQEMLPLMDEMEKGLPRQTNSA